ncbi:magnesium-transporting ATPase (P-type) [Algoriphagus sp. 4150]|uniref:hypothetical protein n=1 Tax=Algoriphagus sp. 4150 TaxID=2817756 RepID=UPI0028663772|nr:hypothetical protein [Algoriphagus sp. 4150]MDR7128821.1 magnesium-transporting ATPase (P-type) [Algoriphagus sp. 4150]
MTFGYTILAMVAAVLMATYAWLMYIFIASANRLTLKSWQERVVNSGIYLIPISGALAASLAYLFLKQNYTTSGYWIVLLPAALMAFYLLFLFCLEKSQ